MNKLLGFYELQKLGLPAVPWKEFTDGTVLPSDRLWTVRVAVVHGPDWNLPRAVGVPAHEALAFAREVKQRLGANGLVIYYPYFVAVKSGTLLVTRARTVLEAVDGDLWNLTTHGRRDVTLVLGDEQQVSGDPAFLTPAELEELKRWAAVVRGRAREHVEAGRAVLLEWSFARDADTQGRPVGPAYLMFYECRVL